MPTTTPQYTPVSPRPHPLERGAGLAFLLLAAVLPWTIAPMGIAAALCGALTLAMVARGARWPRTPVEPAAVAWALALLLSAMLAEDRAASLPRLAKALFPALVGLAAFHARNVERGRHAVIVLLCSSAVASSLGLFRFVQHGASFAA